jgi:hypothetical protein
MKTMLACTALLAMGAFTAVTLAQPPKEDPDGPTPRHEDGPPRGRPDGPPPPPPLMKALDADGDGTISAEEITGASEALKKLDKNDDGKLDLEEVRPPHPPRGPEGRGFEARRARDEFGPPPGGPRARRGGPDEFVRGTRRDGPGPGGPGRDGPGPGGPDGPRPRFPGAGGPPHFLPPHMHDQLDLSDEQIQQIAELHKETREKFEKILTDEQREKLKEFGPPRGPRED